MWPKWKRSGRRVSAKRTFGNRISQLFGHEDSRRKIKPHYLKRSRCMDSQLKMNLSHLKADAVKEALVSEWLRGHSGTGYRLLPQETGTGKPLTTRVDKVLPGSSGGERTWKNSGSFVEDLKHQIKSSEFQDRPVP
eukprot:symbB.v1.2.019850.t1/scaffold1603.1/size109661/3